MALAALVSRTNQYQLKSGALNVGGKIYVYRDETDDLAPVYDEDGRILAQPLVTDSNGRTNGPMVDPEGLYRLVVQDAYGATLYTVRHMVPAGGSGGVNIHTEITSDDGSLIITPTDHGYDISLPKASIIQANSAALTAQGRFGGFQTTSQEGNDLWLDETTHEIKCNKGWYHCDFSIVMQNSTARNEMLHLGFADTCDQWHGAYDLDLSYTDQRCEAVGFDFYIANDGTTFTIIETESGIPSGVKLYLHTLDIHTIFCGALGGAEYTAGTGIDIDEHVVSVDTSVIQPKLVAGTGISIDPLTNTISADKEIVYIDTNTTYQQVCDIVDAGKYPVLKIDISAQGTTGSYAYEVMTSDLRNIQRFYFARIENQSFESGVIYFNGHICYGNRAYYWSSFGRFIATTDDVNTKISKVSGATAGDIVVFDSNGGAADSHHSLSEYQGVLTAGSNISIDSNNVISASAAPQVQSDWDQTDSSAVDYIKNKPSIPAAQVQSDWNQSNSAAVDYIKNKPSIPAAQVQADWNQTNSAAVDYIKNKPDVDDVVIYNYGTATLSQINTAVNAGKCVIVGRSSGAHDYYGYLAEYNSGAYTFVYKDGSYLVSMTISPDGGDGTWSMSSVFIPAAQIQSDWNQTDTTAKDYIQNKPTIPTVPALKEIVAGANITITENTNDITISASGGTQVQSNWNETDNTDPSYIQNKPDLSIYAQSANLATVATTGDYADLTNKPSIPAAQVNSDWNAVSGVSQILNKPSIPVIGTITV